MKGAAGQVRWPVWSAPGPSSSSITCTSTSISFGVDVVSSSLLLGWEEGGEEVGKACLTHAFAAAASNKKPNAVRSWSSSSSSSSSGGRGG